MGINIYYQYTEEIDIKARDQLVKIAMKKKRNLRESHKSPRFGPDPKGKKKKKTKKKGRKRKRADVSKEEMDEDSEEEEEDVRLTEPPKKRQKGNHSWWQKPDVQQYYKEIMEKTGYTPPKNPYIVSEKTPTLIDLAEKDDEEEDEDEDEEEEEEQAERQSDEEEADEEESSAEEESGDEDIDMRERGVSFIIFNNVIYIHFQYF